MGEIIETGGLVVVGCRALLLGVSGRFGVIENREFLFGAHEPLDGFDCEVAVMVPQHLCAVLQLFVNREQICDALKTPEALSTVGWAALGAVAGRQGR